MMEQEKVGKARIIGYGIGIGRFYRCRDLEISGSLKTAH
jgi:hypothetical protein